MKKEENSEFIDLLKKMFGEENVIVEGEDKSKSDADVSEGVGKPEDGSVYTDSDPLYYYEYSLIEPIYSTKRKDTEGMNFTLNIIGKVEDFDRLGASEERHGEIPNLSISYNNSSKNEYIESRIYERTVYKKMDVSEYKKGDVYDILEDLDIMWGNDNSRLPDKVYDLARICVVDYDNEY